jgi:hypothetical protein
MSTLKVNAIQSNTTQSINVNSNLGNISNIEVAGVGTFSGGVVISSGSTSSPSISPTGDSNTGIFFPADDTVCIGEGGAEVLRINSSGLVGVGTITPSSTIDVYGQQANTGSTSAVSPTGTLRLAFDGASAGGSYGSSLVFSQRWFSGTNAQTAVGQIAGVKIAVEGNFGGGLALFTSNGSSNNLLERVRIDSSGNLGISTTTPTVPLQVRGNGSSNTYRGVIRVDNTGADPWAGISFPDSASAADSQSNNYYFIGRGASLSNRTLSVHIPNATDYGSGSQPIFGVFSTGGDKLFQIQASTGNGYFKGNLGIGIESPSQKLSISGTGAVRNEIICADNNAGGAGVYLRTLNSGTQVSNATLRTTNSGTFEVYTGTTSETIKLTIDTSGNLITPDNIGGGLIIGYKKYVTITGSFSANTWYNTGIDRTTDTGIYLLNAYVDTYNTGQSYQMTYTGLFSLPNRGTNSGDASTITLHRAGHAPNSETIQFRTLLTPAVTSGIVYLQWLSNFNLTLDGSGGRNIQVAIHRLTTAFNN